LLIAADIAKHSVVLIAWLLHPSGPRRTKWWQRRERDNGKYFTYDHDSQPSVRT